MKLSVLFTIVFAFVTFGVASAQEKPKPMTNDDVIAMVKAQLPEDTIIDAIGLQETNFDGSATALVNLKKEGVSSKVMDTILATLKKRRDSQTTSQPNGASQFAAPGTPRTQPAATTGKPGTSAPATPSNGTAPAAGVFNKFGELQGQVNTAVQQVSGSVKQTQGALQQPKQGTPQSPQGKQTPAPASAGSTAATLQANTAKAQAGQLPQQNGTVQQQVQQQATDAQKLNEKLAACREPVTQATQAQAANAKAHPEDARDPAKVAALRAQQLQLQKDYAACVQKARTGQ
jgi:hypothetical protein